MQFDFSRNHFELFDLKPQFELDNATLEAAYRQLQAQVHPDKFAHLSEAEKRASMQWSTRVNEAYQTLKSPLNRAVYILQLNGINALSETNTQLAPVFLMQQIEWREAIQDARDGSDLGALQQIEREIAAQTKIWREQLLAQLDQQHDLVAATNTVRQLKFVDKIMSEIDDAYSVLDN
ncbi:Fe-S protein assembly co-chaperone HscB [Sulfuriferula sp. AH1]|nr:Fe-S protein assembly co-chaperone HscB [Sulfuriferula sp. AH1]